MQIYSVCYVCIAGFNAIAIEGLCMPLMYKLLTGQEIYIEKNLCNAKIAIANCNLAQSFAH